MNPPTIHLRLLPFSPSSIPSSSSLPSSSSSPPSSPSSYLFQTLPISSLSYLLPRSLLISSKLLKIYKLTQPTQATISLLFESSTSFKPLLQAKLTQSAPKSYFTEIQLKNTLSACLEALQVLHRANLVHGLICPDVLRQTDGNQIKLADWFCVIKRLPIGVGDLKRRKWHYLPPEALEERCLEKKLQQVGKMGRKEKLGIGKGRREEGGGKREEGGGKKEEEGGKREGGGGKREEGGGKKEDGGGKREEVREEGDLYSLGVLFLEMSTLVSGKELVDWTKRKVKRENVEEGLERVRMRYSKGYWKVIKTLLEEDPKKRREVWKVWEEVEEESEKREGEGGKEELKEEGKEHLKEKEENNYEKIDIELARRDNSNEDGGEETEMGEEEEEEEEEEEKEEEREKEEIEEENEKNEEEEEVEEVEEQEKAKHNSKREDNDKRRNSMEVQTDHKEPLIFSNNSIKGYNKENSFPAQNFQSPTSNLSRTLLFEKFQKKFDESISKTQILIERTKSITIHDNSSKNLSNKMNMEIKEIPAIQTPQFSSKKIIFPSIPFSIPIPPSSPSNPPPLSSMSSSFNQLPPPLPPTLSHPPPPSLPSPLLFSSLSSHPSSTLSTPSLQHPCAPFYTTLSFILPPSFSPPILRLSPKIGLTTIYYKNGQKYQGDVEGLNRHGFGILYTSSGRIFYQGEWKSDQYEGHGILNNPEWTIKEIGGGRGVKREVEAGVGVAGVEWEGFQENLRGGWLKYEGEFKSGKADGKGILLFSSQEFLDGKFSEGKVNGLCWLSMKSGERLFGEWKDNVFIRNLC